jgi:hypothetical protein
MGGARQGDLFSAAADLAGTGLDPELPLLRHQLLTWQKAVARHQSPLFTGSKLAVQQVGLFDDPQPAASGGQPQLALNPLQLRAQPLSFWRWPEPPQRGAALYFVLDHSPLGAGQQTKPLLLYVGETGRADRRWKGEHDCKQYLAAYCEALARLELAARLSIHFWLDAPESARQRRALERTLIQRWLPPFNKETRGRWATPFTADGV